MGRVLVVDDELDICDLIETALTEEGYSVLTAANGAAALQALAGPPSFAPDVILLDLRMPVLDGWAFAQTYRALPGPHVPIVALTATLDPADSASQIGADDVLAKPFELSELLRVVSRFASLL